MHEIFSKSILLRFEISGHEKKVWIHYGNTQQEIAWNFHKKIESAENCKNIFIEFHISNT